MAELLEKVAAKQEQVGELQTQVQEAEGRLEKVMGDVAKGAENHTPDLAKVRELEEILKGINNEGTKKAGPKRSQGQGEENILRIKTGLSTFFFIVATSGNEI